MKNLLREIHETYGKNDEFKRQLENYARYIKSPEGRFVQDVFNVIKGTILVTMLSASYTKLDQTEKDVMQRTFYNISQLLDFLLSPVGTIKEKQNRLSNLADKRNSNQKERSKNG